MDKNKELDSALLYTLFIECTRLEELEIVDFRLYAFPVITQKNDNIKKLILKNNDITQMPESIGQLVALEELSITNPIEDLPISFRNMKALKYLEIKNAEFTSFPTLIFELHKLEKLILNFYSSHSNITNLPDQFDRLKYLQEFTFDYATIASLPKSFTTLSKLFNVSLTNNKFNTFPPELHELPSLRYVSLIGNLLDWKLFYPSIKKIKWGRLLAIYDTNLKSEQYKTVEQTLK